MTFRTKSIPALAALLLPFAGLVPASAQTVILPPTYDGTPTTRTSIRTRGRQHLAARRRTTKTATTTRPSQIVFRGPLHTKHVAPMTLNVQMVWVNVPTGVYHYPGSASYGKTPAGKYMTEADALTQHYRAAFNNQ